MSIGVRLRSGYSDDFKEILIFLAEVTKDFDSSGSRNEGNSQSDYHENDVILIILFQTV